jgi:L-lactate dehydrogenase complex protein LldG
MSARDMILAAVRAAKPEVTGRPNVREAVARFPSRGDVIATFIASAESAGARVIQGARAELPALLAEAYPDRGRRVSAFDAVQGSDASPHSFADADVFICEAVVGVAENGGVWLPLSRLQHRSAIFLATNVIVVLDRARIVGDFHEAYASVDVAAEGFGVFVAGPSKTADIEQALVIGAHGAKSLTVILLDGSAASMQAD